MIGRMLRAWVGGTAALILMCSVTPIEYAPLVAMLSTAGLGAVLGFHGGKPHD